ncbi:MAG TPA: hypothetical protein VGO63_00590 [Candidatus Paceibacterota bacterium]|jgi:hypothetical protein|nr:hypothetical protein [Candidatus Paceibacterota bacterium]
MDSVEERIFISKNLREKTAKSIAEILLRNKNISETKFRDKLKLKVLDGKKVYKEGYYSPPPFGIAALFGYNKDFKRLSFGTLRIKEKWPKNKYVFKREAGTATFYVSPVNISTGMIGDFGISLYTGNDKTIQTHFKNCVKILDELGKFAKVGMEFRELYKQYNMLLKKYGVKKTQIILQKYNKNVGDNLGHAIPWSYEDPTETELSILSRKNFKNVKNLIRKKRIFINSKARFKILPTMAFTLEFRAGSKKLPLLPNTSFHIMVFFLKGKKTVLINFDEIFKAVGMKYMQTK